MREPCPRCGADRPSVGACLECGFEPEHPGVLGSYGAATRRLAARPSLLVPFLVPTLVLVITQTLLLQVPGADAAIDAPVQAAAGLVALFLQVGWYLATVGAIVPAVADEASLTWPTGPVLLSGVLGGALIVTPWILVASMLVVQPTGTMGAMALLASILLLIGAVFVAGRAVGLPVEAALSGRTGTDLLRHGNDRGRENGGLGLVFLALLLFGSLTLIPGLLAGLGIAQLSPWTLLLTGGITSWILGAWIGVALAIGLVGEGSTQRTFTCPACGAEATVEGGRARCECGLEGPYYPVKDPAR